MKNERKKVVIVGAGPGGLTAGMILAHRGLDVHIYEKADRVGGRNAELRVGDHRFDTGPTFLMMKFILDEMFAETGRNSADYLEFVKLEHMYRLLFNDRTMDMSSDPAKMKAEIAKHFPGEEEGYDRFLETEARRFLYMYPCLQKDYGSWKDFIDPTLLKALPHIPLRGSLYDYLGNYFKSEELRLAFTFQAKYLGMSPWECPAFFIMLPYLEHKYGIYHVKGGLSRISDAMAKVVEEEGGTIHLNTPVKEVVLKGKTATGVLLESGEIITADHVFMNADFGYAMTNLLPPEAVPKYSPKKLESYDLSCSTFMLYLGLDTVYEDLPHHSIVFAEDYRTNVNDIFNGKDISLDTSFYVRNSVINDEQVSPAGKSGLYVLVPTPNNRAGIDWREQKQAYRDHIIQLMEQRLGLTNLASHIEAEAIITPDDWESQANVYEGAVFNLGHNMSQMLYFRPHNRFEEIDGMYLVGGGTHPGSGLPTIYESARISANLMCKAAGVSFSPPPPLKEKL